MVDQVIASEDVYIFGQPGSIDVNISTGAQGSRGTYIFQGAGKPTDPGMSFEDNYNGQAKSIQPKDMFINIKPTDDEYLYLYQYEQTITGTYQWVKTLRLVPNTAIGNLSIIFYAGRIITPIPVGTYDPGETLPTIEEIIADIDTYLALIIPSLTAPGTPTTGTLWLDISLTPQVLKIYSGTEWKSVAYFTEGYNFPINAYFPLLISEGTSIQGSSFNIQYSLAETNVSSINKNPKPIASTISVGDVSESGTDLILPIYLEAVEATTTYSGGTPTVAWLPLTGTKIIHVLITAGIGN